MANEQIKNLIKERRLFRYEVAEQMGISEGYLSTLLRKPLSEDMEHKVEEAITSLTGGTYMKRTVLFLNAEGKRIETRTVVEAMDIEHMIDAREINSIMIKIAGKEFEAFYNLDGEFVSGCPETIVRDDEEPVLYGNIVITAVGRGITEDEIKLIKSKACYNHYNLLEHIVID